MRFVKSSFYALLSILRKNTTITSVGDNERPLSFDVIDFAQYVNCLRYKIFLHNLKIDKY